MTKDNINQLIEDIESQGFNYVIGIIKPSKVSNSVEEIEIFTNGSDDGLKKLFFILKEHQKSNRLKKETKELANE